MGVNWQHIKAFLTRRDSTAPTSNEQDFVTSTDYPGKRGLDVAMHLGGGVGDAFGRLRVSQVTTLFDSKQLRDSLPLFWDDQETSGTGTTSTHNANQASTSIGVALNTAGTRVRQTFQRFNYSPGKSQLVTLTGVIGAGASGQTRSMGYYDEKNGLMFQIIDGTMGVVCRSYTSGSAVDTRVEQSAWNLDKMDGAGASGHNLNYDLAQIFFFDFEWLGVGRVRFGVFIDGVPIHVHQFLNTNVLDKVYMTTPNLPVRYEISNDGTGAAGTLVHICSSVSTEGGTEDLGILRHYDSASISSLSSGGKYALLGGRLKSTHLDISVLLSTLSVLATSANDVAHWSLIFNPTVAGTFTYVDVPNSAVQVAQGVKANTITNGIEIDGGYFTTALPTSISLPNALKLGSKIDGTPDEIILLVRPITNNITVEASMTWRELS